MKRPRLSNKGLRKLCDCRWRSWAKCPHSWYFNFKPRGGPSHCFSLDKHFNCHIGPDGGHEDAVCTANL